ncbi:Uncharacterised ACR, YkgG family COG1556 [Acetomicrobium flavidum]|uniref:Uncharacterized ACR, YkgG family COG1556 n=1 Tax=Acetomicrobium flavidum TaxID=49896 RepID=A0ABY1JAG5_9BACT|nr:Uncharacterised ACR, YkgG family COG1556 [Acetomicrobium flavidum]
MADWEAFRKRHYELLGSAIVNNLNKKGYKAEYARTAVEAKDKVLELIPKNASVGIPGSVTVRELGLLEELEKRGNKIVHHWDPNLAGAERIQRLQEELLCDVFLTSANAVTIDGTMVNIDGNGNRVAGMAWAAGKIIYVIGINKVCPGGLEAAIARVKNFATPPNAMRLNIKTPCASLGYCVDCDSPERVCRAMLVLERAPQGRQSHVIIVGEVLGF